MSRRPESPADELITRLNAAVAQVMSTRRRLQREVERLSQRAVAAKAPKPAKRASRPAPRPVKKARPAPKPKRKPVQAKSRKAKTVTRKRR